MARFGLSEDQIARGITEAREKVERRMTRLCARRAPPSISGRIVIVVDDGIAAGSTIRTAIAAVRQQKAREIVVAEPSQRTRYHCRARGCRVLREYP